MTDQSLFGSALADIAAGPVIGGGGREPHRSSAAPAPREGADPRTVRRPKDHEPRAGDAQGIRAPVRSGLPGLRAAQAPSEEGRR